MRRTRLGVSIIALVLSSCGQRPSTDALLPKTDLNRNTIHIESAAFTEGGSIPKVYTCDGKGVSPPLAWSGVPERARSLALICEDPDAPKGTWTHWVMFSIPADLHGLDEGVPADPEVKLATGKDRATQGTNDFGKFGYGGPCPPSGSHHYVFRIFALDTDLHLDPKTTRQELLQAIKDHIVADGKLTGVYSR